MGDLLRIDLTSGTSREETIPPELIRELVGAKGLGTWYLSQEVGPDVDPLDPANKLVFAVGPMAGTTMLGSNRFAVYFASPLTGVTSLSASPTTNVPRRSLAGTASATAAADWRRSSRRRATGS